MLRQKIKKANIVARQNRCHRKLTKKSNFRLLYEIGVKMRMTNFGLFKISKNYVMDVGDQNVYTSAKDHVADAITRNAGKNLKKTIMEDLLSHSSSKKI
jgi:RNase P protein component